MSKVLNVLYQSDDNYAPQTGVSMVSLLENNKHFDEIRIYILNDNIKEANLAKMQQACDGYGRTLILVDTKKILQRLKDLNVTPFRGGYTTYFKLFAIQDLDIPTDRVLQIDGDTIINEPLDELLDIPLEGKVCAATYECVLNEYKTMVGIPERDKYYNCGVLLINQEFWRSYECESKITDHLTNTRNRYFTVDQDIINVLFRDKITYLDVKYNLNSGFYIYGVDESYRIYNLDPAWYCTRDQIRVAMNKPFINHCMGAMTGRPWEEDSIHPQNDLYDTYLAISPWKDQKKIVVKRSFLFRTQRVLYTLLPRSLYGAIHKAALKRYLKDMNDKGKGEKS